LQNENKDQQSNYCQIAAAGWEGNGDSVVVLVSHFRIYFELAKDSRGGNGRAGFNGTPWNEEFIGHARGFPRSMQF
jgi:hypothetical protein